MAPALSNAEPRRWGRRKQSKARNLLDQFRDHPHHILALMGDSAVPFDKNQAERDLWMMKPRQKFSGMFRNLQSLTNFCRTGGLHLHGPLEPILSDCRLQHLILASDRPSGDAVCSPLVFGKKRLVFGAWAVTSIVAQSLVVFH